MRLRCGLREFFECPTHGFVGKSFHVSKFHHPVGQEPMLHLSLPSGASEHARATETRLHPAVQGSPSRPARLLRHQRHLQPVLAKVLPLAGHRDSGNFKSLGDPLVGPTIGAVGVGFQQDAPVKQLARMRPATADEPLDLLAFIGGEADDLLLVHAENPRWLDASEGTRSCSTTQPIYDRELEGRRTSEFVARFLAIAVFLGAAGVSTVGAAGGSVEAPIASVVSRIVPSRAEIIATTVGAILIIHMKADPAGEEGSSPGFLVVV